MPDSQTIVTTCAKHADEIQAEDIVVLDLRGLSSIADFFLLCTGTSVPHLKAISREIRQGTEEEIGESPRTTEGDATSHWLVIDYVDVVVHIFHADKRSFYALEDLWSDAPPFELDLPSVTKGEP